VREGRIRQANGQWRYRQTGNPARTTWSGHPKLIPGSTPIY
jgi:hypothetical protein